MDHRITVTIVTVFGGLLGFTLLTAMLATSSAPGDPDAAMGYDADDAPKGPSPREQLVSLLHLLDATTAKWQRDHGGRLPDFQAHAGWEQLLRPTGADGGPKAGGSSGRYLSQVPVNPLNKLSSVITVDQPMRQGARVATSDGGVGFVYSTADHCYWGTNGSGRVVLTRAEGVSPTPATAPAPAPPAAAATPSDD